MEGHLGWGCVHHSASATCSLSGPTLVDGRVAERESWQQLRSLSLVAPSRNQGMCPQNASSALVLNVDTQIAGTLYIYIYYIHEPFFCERPLLGGDWWWLVVQNRGLQKPGYLYAFVQREMWTILIHNRWTWSCTPHRSLVDQASLLNRKTSAAGLTGDVPPLPPFQLPTGRFDAFGRDQGKHRNERRMGKLIQPRIGM